MANLPDETLTTIFDLQRRNKKELESSMNSQPKIPDPETRTRSIAWWQEICLMFDDLNMLLDEAIALAEADIRNSRINVERRHRARNLLETK